MKKEFRTFFALSLLAVAGQVLPAMAADSGVLRVTVPFPFTAGTVNLPPGDYVVTQQGDSRILTIGGKGGSAILITVPQQSATDLPSSNLIFERTEKGNMLKDVQFAGKQSMITNRAAK